MSKTETRKLLHELTSALAIIALILASFGTGISTTKAAINTGDGTDGAYSTSSADQVINTYTNLASAASAGATSITVGSATGFTAGDEILIHQTQHGTETSAGIYEFKVISSIGGTTFNFASGLTNAYTTGSAGVITQVIRVPQYTSVTISSGGSITATAWNGTLGGIVVFRATGTVNVQSGGSITVSSTGGSPSVTYRGGFRGTSNVGCIAGVGRQGESYNGGLNGQSNLANNGGGGGGTLTGSYEEPSGGGGGGGYGGAGSAGTPRYTSGQGAGGGTYGVANLSRINLGSGGGAEFCWYYSGDGGGIIMIYADTITVSGTIKANGRSLTNNGYEAALGAGSGGSVYLGGNTLTLGTNLVTATGGLSFSNNNCIYLNPNLLCGGDAGAGRIAIQYGSYTGESNPASNKTSLTTAPTVTTQAASSLGVNNSMTWTERRPIGDVNGYWESTASDSDGSNLVAGVGTNNYLYTSSNYGANWTQNGSQMGAIYGLASDSDGSNLIAGVYGGYVYTSTDSGVSWAQNLTSGGNKYWRAIASDNDGSN
ncbi:MAG: hypothetical protein AAB503_01560 [Patescibacteria group bacterium]